MSTDTAQKNMDGKTRKDDQPDQSFGKYRLNPK